MDSQAAASTVLGHTIIEWLGHEALLAFQAPALHGELCRRWRAIGLPLLRGQVAFRILHPLYAASTVNWTGETGIVVDHFSAEDRAQDRFRLSPIGHTLTH